jgi:hypothetical protein
MSTAETKIELVTEAIEALVLASVIAATAADADRALNHQNVLDARDTLKGCLKEFLAPTLRIISSERTDRVGEVSITRRKEVITGIREISETVPYEGKGIDGMNLA